MKKNLLLSSALLLAASTMTAAAPEGNLYLTVSGGIEDEPTSVVTLPFVAGERDQDDIEEGIWRWSISSVDITEAIGSLSVTGENGFSLGYDEDNIFGLPGVISDKSNRTYLSPSSTEEVMYWLSTGEYQVFLGLFEDLDGDMGGDMWSLQLVSLNQEPDDNFYLLGFNGNDEPSASIRFVKEEIPEENGTVSYVYSLPRIYLSDCSDGFTVFDSAAETTYGEGDMPVNMDPEEAINGAILSLDGKGVAWNLPSAYYTVNFAPVGEMGMVTFIKCEDQTANNELEYYLVGLNGINDFSEANKFIREVESGSYKDEESGETVTYETVTYTLVVEVKEESELMVVAKDNVVEFGYNPDMASMLPNDMNDDMAMAALVTYGEPVNCTLTPGTYTFTFSLSDSDGSIGFLSALPADDGAVEGVEMDSDAAPVYYNLQGQRVMNPSKGIFIEKRGSKTSKVIL